MEICNNPLVHCTKYAGKKLHLGITGSVACYKTVEIMRCLQKMEILVSVTLTRSAQKFLNPLLFRALDAEPVYGEMFETQDAFAHLEPGQAADCLAILPASADFLAKMAAGLADDMLSCQYLSFSGPVIAAPAMNPRMWANAATRRNVRLLRERGQTVIDPEDGRAACGDHGAGRLARTEIIILELLKALTCQDMAGLKVMLTLGPTREAWDGVRYWSNPSSGRMGCALATVAWARGAEVTAICGPGVEFVFPDGIKTMTVESAREMYDSACRVWPRMDMGIFCAAVADYAPVPAGRGIKVSKRDIGDKLCVEFTQNPDILATLAQKRGNNQKVLGFAAQIASEMPEVAAKAREKLFSKNADLLAGNMVNPENGAFGAKFAAMAVVDKYNRQEIWPPKSKADIAWDLLTWLLKI